MGRSGSLTPPREEQAVGWLHFCDVLPWGSRLICGFFTQSNDEARQVWKTVWGCCTHVCMSCCAVQLAVLSPCGGPGLWLLGSLGTRDSTLTAALCCSLGPAPQACHPQHRLWCYQVCEFCLFSKFMLCSAQNTYLGNRYYPCAAGVLRNLYGVIGNAAAARWAWCTAGCGQIHSLLCNTWFSDSPSWLHCLHSHSFVCMLSTGTYTWPFIMGTLQM